jgi:hypothetical protein
MSNRPLSAANICFLDPENANTARGAIKISRPAKKCKFATDKIYVVNKYSVIPSAIFMTANKRNGKFPAEKIDLKIFMCYLLVHKFCFIKVSTHHESKTTSLLR